MTVTIMPGEPEDGERLAICSGASAGLITMLSGALTLLSAASVATTVKALVPLVVGVPEMVPVAPVNVNPAGKLPLDTDQEYGAVPPVICKVAV